MANRRLKGISLETASMAVGGRTISFTTFSFNESRNKSVVSAIGAEISTTQGSGDRTWNGEAILTEEDWIVINQIAEDESVTQITGRIPIGNGNYDNILLQGVEINDKNFNLQGDGSSTVSLSGIFQSKQRTS